ncbi:MAG: hypothetical protein K0Q53_44 [Massilibacillus sp.]|nr:hypothetical protein [Massilibacillus sp.]
MLRKIILCTMLAFAFAATVFAASPEDFTYKGIKLGDDYETMVAKIGQPRVNFDYIVKDNIVTYYFYKGNDMRIGIDRFTNKIVDFRVSDKEYVTDKGVRIGATSHKILKEYGLTNKEKINGHIYYIYKNPQDEKQQLLLDVSQGDLEEFRITTLAEE